MECRYIEKHCIRFVRNTDCTLAACCECLTNELKTARQIIKEILDEQSKPKSDGIENIIHCTKKSECKYKSRDIIPKCTKDFGTDNIANIIAICRFADVFTLITPPPMKPPKPHILYLCDRRACENCNAECKYTTDIKHAKNYELNGNTFVEVEQ